MRKLVMVVLLSVLALPASAHASFPGANGKIAFVRGGDIWTMNPDGTSQTNLTNSAAVEGSPNWSADGNRIVFSSGGLIRWMYADGTGSTPITVVHPNRGDYEPAWSPNGQKVAFGAFCPPPYNTTALMTTNLDGTGEAIIGFNDEGIDWPDWSPDGSSIVSTYWDNCAGAGVWQVDPGGTSSSFITGSTCRESDITDIQPSWSPDMQRIAFASDSPSRASDPHSIWTVQPDGTDLQQLTTAPDFSNEHFGPVWSPDGSRIAFTRGNVVVAGGRITVMDADGSAITDVTDGRDPDWQPTPTASPAADVLATLTDAPDPVKAGDELHYTASAKNLVGPDNASGVTLTVNLPASVFYVSATPTQGSCSQASHVVTCNFGALTKGATASVDIDVEPRPVIANTQITASANVTASQNDPVPGNNSASTTTTVQPGAHVRPKGATPLRVPLVPSYRQCGSEATLRHGAPLSYPSCGNPQLSSGYLTFGTPDANGKGANSIGSVIYTVLGESPIDPNNGDQADVTIDFSLTDVRNKSDLTDYTGEVVVNSQLRITDRDNGAGGFTSATVMDIPFPVFATCVATASTTVGATCSVHTTADAVIPGSVKESKRAVWALGQVQVLDGGPDGAGATNDNTLYAVEGVYAP